MMSPCVRWTCIVFINFVGVIKHSLKSPKVSYKKCYDLLFENESVQCASERFS